MGRASTGSGRGGARLLFAWQGEARRIGQGVILGPVGEDGLGGALHHLVILEHRLAVAAGHAQRLIHVGAEDDPLVADRIPACLSHRLIWP